ncbi:MAG: endolytic transglycosylase MltG [Bacteroidales bacterium]|nr:endolytic transglycosylase MltG [Bacteroidales bacterium]
MKKKNKRRLIFLIAAAILFIAAIICWEYVRDNRLGNFESSVNLYVYPDMGPDEVIAEIEKSSVIRHKAALKSVFREKQVATYIKPGYYRITPSTSSVALARMLNNGWQSPVNLVLSGSIRLKEDLARKISNQLMLSKEDVLGALNDRALLAEYGFTPETVFALFIPDTYSCYWTTSMKEIFDIQKKAWDAFWTPEKIRSAEKQGLDKIQVSILASIVQGESHYEPEQPLIAGVYLNRLDKNMLLQADPTVAFCFDYSINRVLNKHLRFDSPYNTYLYPGLPPGPICVPSKACLKAVLNPDRKDGYLYFCANPDFSGTHVFAKDFSQHAVNAHKFQQELTRRQKAKN